MARIRSDYNNYVPAGTTQTIHSGAGKLHAVLASTSSGTASAVTLYDNTAGSGNILLKLNLTNGAPANIIFPAERPLRFYTGLTIVTDAYSVCFVITET
jgi:hypothetical protein